MADTREILLKLIGRETVSTAAKKAAGGLDDLGDSADGARKHAKKLDDQLADTEKQITATLRELAKDPGDIGLRKQLRALDRESKALGNLRTRFGKLGDDSASGFAAAFMARVGPLFARLPVSPQLGIALAAGVTAASPAIGAAASAAVLGGLSGGVVAAGVAAAFRDPKVKAEGASLGLFLGEQLSQATRSFVPATINAMDIIRDEVGGLGDDLEAAFGRGATYVAPLTRALGNLVRGPVSQLPEALEKSGGVIRSLERGAQLVGDAVGDAMDSIADGSSGAALVLTDMLAATAVGVRSLGESVGFLSKAYSVMRVATAANKTDVLTEIAQGQVAAAGYRVEFDRLAEAIRNGGSAARGTAEAVRTLDQILNAFADAATTAFNAETKFGEALDEAKAKIYNNSAGINANTEKGRANRDMLEKLATQTRSSAAALEGMAGGQGKANALMNAGYKAFLKAAEGMNLSKKEARELAAQLGLIPRSITTTHTLIKRTRIESGRQSSRGERVSGPGGSGTQVKYAAGGAVTGGTPGRDSVSILAMPGEYVLRKEAVQAMGGAEVLDAINRGRAGPAASRHTALPTGTSRLEVVPVGTGDRLLDAVVEMLRFRIKRYGGGSAQGYLGTG